MRSARTPWMSMLAMLAASAARADFDPLALEPLTREATADVRADFDACFYNFDFVSSRTDGLVAGTCLVAGPGCKGSVPRGGAAAGECAHAWFLVRDALQSAGETERPRPVR